MLSEGRSSSSSTRGGGGGGSGKKPFRKEGEHEEVSSGESLAEMTPRQRRLARNKVVSQSRKRGAPGKVTGTIGGTPKLPEGFDLEDFASVRANVDTALRAIWAYEEVGASRKIIAVCEAAAKVSGVPRKIVRGL